MGRWEAWTIDEMDAQTLDWVRALPLTLTVGDVFVCHATPSRDDENWLDRRGPDQRLIARDLQDIAKHADGLPNSLILCGHTHAPRSLRLPDGRRIVNAGAVGCPAYLDIRMEPNFIHQTGAPDARYAIVETQGNDWMVDLVSVPYDPTPMIELAFDKGADSWAHALRTGWFV